MSAKAPFGRKSAIVLTALYHLNPEERAALLKKASPTLVKTICECALNILAGNVNLTKNHKTRLRKHVKVLRKISRPGARLARKKQIIVQHGGFLPALLAPLLGSVLAGILSSQRSSQ